MKVIRTVFLLVVALVIVNRVKAGDAFSAAKLVDSIKVSPVVVLNGSEITGEHTLGAGIDIGFGVNEYVSINVANYTYESEGWKSSVVDQTEIYGKANFAKFKNESLLLYGKGGVTRDWNDDAYALGVGLGVQLNITKNVSLASDYTINAWFSGPNDKTSLARALVNFSF